MDKANFKFLDRFEQRVWDMLVDAKIKFTVTDEFWDGKSLVKTPEMHHYEFDAFLDVHHPVNHKQPFAGGTVAVDGLEWEDDARIDMSMPDLRALTDDREDRVSTQQDTIEKLGDLEEKGKALEKDLAVLADKVTAYFYEANRVVQQAQEETCEWSTLAGIQCKGHVDVLKQIAKRFDEKIAALRFGLGENRIHSIINQLEARYEEATEYAAKVLEEIRKLA